MRYSKLVCFLLIACLTSCLSESETNHPWKGKKVAYLGDSITDPNNPVGLKKYWVWLTEWFGAPSYVYGKSGREWTDIPRQAALLKQEHGDDVDAIVVFVGTNDWNHHVPLGEWYAETDAQVEYAHAGVKKQLVERKHREFIMEDSTFRGRINVALDSLKRMYPSKQIVLLTPIHRARFYHTEMNWQTTEDYANAIGLYLDSYVQCVKEAANVWAVPVVDLNSVSGLFPMHECQDYFGHEVDRLHPNDEGQRRMALTIYHQLSALPGGF